MRQDASETLRRYSLRHWIDSGECSGKCRASRSTLPLAGPQRKTALVCDPARSANKKREEILRSAQDDGESHVNGAQLKSLCGDVKFGTSAAEDALTLPRLCRG